MTRLQEGETAEGNLRDLTTFCSDVIQQVTQSVNTFMPVQLQVLCRELQAAVESRWPGMGHAILLAFLFLRVICPAIIVPESLVALDVPPERKRPLVLLSKSMQAVANGTLCYTVCVCVCVECVMCGVYVSYA